MMAGRKCSWVTAVDERNEVENKTTGTGENFEQGDEDGGARDANRAGGKCSAVHNECADPRFAKGGQTGIVKSRCEWAAEAANSQKAAPQDQKALGRH